MKALIYRLALRSPVLISRPGAGEENSDRSYPFITGSAIRGALAARYLNKHTPDDEFRRRFLSGETRFLNAYPEHQGRRTLPVPLSWHVAKKEKEQPHTKAFDFVYRIPDEDELRNPKSLGEGFVTVEEENQRAKIITASTTMQVSVHNVGYERGIKKEGASSLFQYEAIAPGSLFSGVILGKKADLEIMKGLLTEKAELWLGGSRNAGYGRSVVLDVRIQDGWQETMDFKRGDAESPNGKVVVTLLSDAIVRDKNGSYSVHPQDLMGAAPEQVFLRIRVVGGFNRTWGLPLVQAPVFQAGSVFVYDSKHVDMDKLGRWQTDGLGERLAEGFGRIAVNWLAGESFTIHRGSLSETEAKTESRPPELDDESRALARRMAQRHYQALLDDALMQRLSNLSLQGKKPSNAQLNKLRQALRRVQEEGTWAPLSRHLDNLNTDARKQLERARIDGEKFIDWLHLAEKNCLWGRYFDDICPPTIAWERAQPDNALTMTYEVRLLDGLLQKAVREKGA